MTDLKTSFTLMHGIRKPFGNGSNGLVSIPIISDTDGALYNRQLVRRLNGSNAEVRGDNITADGLQQTGVFGADARSFPYAFNGSTLDRHRNNTQETVLASGSRSANTDSPDLINYNGLGGHFVIDVTVVPGVDTITPTIQGKDLTSGKYYDLLEGTAIVATGITVLKIHPGIAGLANASANDLLPRIFRVSFNHSAGGSFTYSCGLNLVN